LKYNFIFLINVLMIMFTNKGYSQVTYNAEAEKLLEIGRNLFYASVEDESKLDSAFLIFEKYQKEYPEYQGRATTYRGVLTALRGRHAFWVYSKYKLVKEGLKIMDEGISQSPNDLEALFVYGSTCYFMPGLFGRDDSAQNAFVKIIELLPQNIQNYNPAIMGNVIDFLIEHTELTNQQIARLTDMKKDLNLK